VPILPVKRNQQLSEDKYKNIGADNHDTIGTQFASTILVLISQIFRA